MDAGKNKINDILNGNRQLVIPFFQCLYGWIVYLLIWFIERMRLVYRTEKEKFLYLKTVNFELAPIIYSNTYLMEQKGHLRIKSYDTTINIPE